MADTTKRAFESTTTSPLVCNVACVFGYTHMYACVCVCGGGGAHGTIIILLCYGRTCTILLLSRHNSIVHIIFSWEYNVKGTKEEAIG